MKKQALDKLVSNPTKNVREKSATDLSVKKLTLKTGVRAGLRSAGTCETSCCPRTCHG